MSHFMLGASEFPELLIEKPLSVIETVSARLNEFLFENFQS